MPRRADPNLRREIVKRILRPIVVTLLLTGSAAALSTWMYYDLGVVRVAGVLLGAVLLSAMLFGVGAGLLSALVGAAAFNVLIGPAAVPDQLQSPKDIVLLSLLIAGSCVAAVYAEIAGRRDAATALAPRPKAAKDTPPAPDVPAPGAQAEAEAEGPSVMTGTARKLLATLAIAVGTLLAASLLRSAEGGSLSLVFAAATAALAALHGARAGLAVAGLAFLALNVIAPSSAISGQTAWLQAPVDAAILGALGWGVGRLSDQAQRGGRTLKAMALAGRDFAAAADERAAWKALFDSLLSLSPDASVRLVDAAGETLHQRIRPEAGQEIAWRTRRVSNDDQDFGVVYWAAPRMAAGDSDTRDELMAAVVDLGASAVVRNRLGVEKAEMEFIARTEQLRTILLDAVSHHFRTPLAGIIGSVTSVLSLPEPHDRAARRDLLLIIKEQANRLHRYVENFLSVARLESGAIEMKLEEIAVEPLLYDVWDSFGEAGGARRFLHVKVDSDPVRGDADLLAQVFGNVLENAIKFSAEGSVVDIRTRRDGGRLVFDVSDQGCGVPPASQAKIFDRFFRAREAAAPGLGLGLYITRSLVELQGGAVEAHSRADGSSGLVVSIALPLAEAA